MCMRLQKKVVTVYRGKKEQKSKAEIHFKIKDKRRHVCDNDSLGIFLSFHSFFFVIESHTV